MKRFIVFLLLVFCSAAHADTETINWYMDNNVYATTTCESGGDITLPTTPTKYGYTFQGWSTYTPIEYLESTGTQYIDTGYVVEFTDSIEMVFAENEANKNKGMSFFGARYNGDVGGGISFGHSSDNKILLDFFAGNRLDTNIILISDEIYRLIIQNKTFYLNDNNANLYTYTFNSNRRAPFSLFIFTLNNGGQAGVGTYMKLKSFIIRKQDGTLVRDFIPVLDGNGVPCMYDRVEQKYYYNAGTGDFVAGPIIGE